MRLSFVRRSPKHLTGNRKGWPVPASQLPEYFLSHAEIIGRISQ
jgi:hypothetical protein